MNWDPLQREVIAALGYTLYRAEGPAATPDDAQQGANPVGDLDSALLHALLRAADADVSASDAVALCRRWIATSSSTGAAARRALWPQLRRLRGQRLS